MNYFQPNPIGQPSALQQLFQKQRANAAGDPSNVQQLQPMQLGPQANQNGISDIAKIFGWQPDQNATDSQNKLAAIQHIGTKLGLF